MKPTNFGAGVSRRAIMGSALAMPFLRIGPARAAEFNYKLATGQSLTQPINPRLEQACGRIREATSGRLEIRFFPASQLGSDTDLLTQVRSGGTEFLNISGSVLSTVVSQQRSRTSVSPFQATIRSGRGWTEISARMSEPR